MVVEGEQVLTLEQKSRGGSDEMCGRMQEGKKKTCSDENIKTTNQNKYLISFL